MQSRKKLGILVTHPIQYYSPLYRELAGNPSLDLTVYYAHRQTAEGQSRAGFEVAFEWDVPLSEGFNHRFLKNESRHPGTDSFGGCSTPEIAGIIKNEKFDAFVVQGWYNRSYLQAVLACWKCRVPVLVRGDSQLRGGSSSLFQIIKYPFYRCFIPRFDAYLCVGKRARDYYLRFGAEERRCFFSPHAVDNEFFEKKKLEYLSQRTQLRRQWSLEENAAVYLFAGKFIDKKRPMDFIRAIEMARRSGIEGLMAGDGPLRSACEKYAKSNGIPVRFTGFLNQSEMPKAFAVSDALVLPSDARETWGLVVNEAMAAGLPALASEDCGCVPDLVENGRTGGVFPTGDVKMLAEWMENLGKDRQLLKSISQEASRRIRYYSVKNAAYGFCEALEFVAR